jgi:hypothetical protein
LIIFGQQSNINWQQPTENLFLPKFATLFVGLSSKTAEFLEMNGLLKTKVFPQVQ